MGDFNYLHIIGVNDLPSYHAAAAFTTKSSEVFKEAEEISPRHVSDKVSYMPWGADDQMPYDIINYCFYITKFKYHLCYIEAIKKYKKTCSFNTFLNVLKRKPLIE